MTPALLKVAAKPLSSMLGTRLGSAGSPPVGADAPVGQQAPVNRGDELPGGQVGVVLRISAPAARPDLIYLYADLLFPFSLGQGVAWIVSLKYAPTP